MTQLAPVDLLSVPAHIAVELLVSLLTLFGIHVSNFAVAFPLTASLRLTIPAFRHAEFVAAVRAVLHLLFAHDSLVSWKLLGVSCFGMEEIYNRRLQLSTTRSCYLSEARPTTKCGFA
jgi:hypothetical protein